MTPQAFSALMQILGAVTTTIPVENGYQHTLNIPGGGLTMREYEKYIEDNWEKLKALSVSDVHQYAQDYRFAPMLFCRAFIVEQKRRKEQPFISTDGTLICEGCGCRFKPNSPKQMYHSGACRRAYYDKIKRLLEKR